MRKIRNLIGMPVVCRRQKIGRLVQADLSPDLKRLEGVWVDSGLRGTRYLSADQVGMIGEVAVIADDRGRRRRCSTSPLLYRAVSTGGERIGAVVGAEIDEVSFLVRALEVTLGLWDDLYAGRLRVENYTVNSQNGEVIVVDSAQECEREDDL